MKKKRAILLFGSLIVLLLGYTAWCGRTFYLTVPVPELLELPEQYREDAKSIVIERGLTRPDHFHPMALVRLLAKPYDSSPEKIRVECPNSSTMWIIRSRRSHWPDDVPMYLTRTQDGWRDSGYKSGNELRPGRYLKPKVVKD